MTYLKRNYKNGLIVGTIGMILMIGTMFSSSAIDDNDKIHFIDVGSSNAVLLESNNRFALIDTGKTEDEGVIESEKVLSYLNSVAKDENGIINLDFLVATHPNKNAIGGLSEIINNENVKVSKVVIEDYEDSTKRVRLLEDENNVSSYYELINVVSEKNIERVDNPNKSIFRLGDFSLSFINTLAQKEQIQFLEDSNSSMAVKVTKNNKTALITGGLNNVYMDESRVSSDIGDVDLLLLANNGNRISSSETFLNVLKPEKCILSSKNENLYPSTFAITKRLKSDIYSTEDNGDIVATFFNDEIKLDAKNKMKNGWYKNFHKTYYYDENGELLKGFHNIDNETYLFDDNGVVTTGWINLEEGTTLYANSNGVIQKGLCKITVNNQEKIYGFNQSGLMQTGWHIFNDNWYYFNENIEDENFGTALVGVHVLDYNGKQTPFMFDNEGVMQIGLREINGRYYYFNDDPNRAVVGEMLRGKHYLKINEVEDTYDFGKYGILQY